MIAWRYLLTPFASSHREVRSDGGRTVRHYSYYFIFGIRVAVLHRPNGHAKYLP